jgi:uncharacterized membrane protein YkoI
MRVTPVLLPTLLLGLTLGLAATPAAASVDIEDVRAMAFDRGIVRIEEIELHQRRGVWEVEGEDAYGHDIEMKVDARTGRVIKMERD